ncbi:MAG: pyridoxamine 5'-phosphate oxidase family protein [Clostridium sp.]
MNKVEIFELLNSNPAFHLATVEGNQPRVRGMLLYKADEDGIVFHTALSKDLYTQVINNSKAELCFNNGGTQVRVTGELEIVEDRDLKDKIRNHPSRIFMKPWLESGQVKDFYKEIIVFRLKEGTAVIWTLDKNFDKKVIIQL